VGACLDLTPPPRTIRVNSRRSGADAVPKNSGECGAFTAAFRPHRTPSAFVAHDVRSASPPHSKLRPLMPPAPCQVGQTCWFAPPLPCRATFFRSS
jgi:hypothetical protein